MIEIGKYQTLTIDRDTAPGLFMVDAEGEEVLLPGKFMPENFEVGQQIEVFVYLDNEKRLTATTQKPFITLGSFAVLYCSEVSKLGAFMDWGLDKDLLVPFANQARPIKEGDAAVVFMYLDEKSGRLVGSTKVNQFLNEDNTEIAKFDKVEIIVDHFSEFGAHVIINESIMGLIHKEAIFEELRIGDRLPAYIKWVRDDGKIDVVLQPEGYKSIEPNAEYILEEIKANIK